MGFLERLAWNTRIGIQDAHDLNLNFGETTITDLCLLAIGRSGIPNIRVAAARGRDEPDKGFDWEWFIRYPQSNWLRFSVQAKKLSPTTGKYSSLRHAVDGQLQIDLLEDFARAQGAIPLYAFYNFPPSLHSAKWNCRQPKDESQYGCTLVPLRDVRLIHDDRCRKDFDAVHSGPRAVPWRCIACAQMDTGQLATRDHPVLRALAPEGVEVREYEALPPSIANIGERRTVEVTGLAYASELDAYPKRIAVIDLSPSV